jgi:hypothetical protein
VWHFVLRNEYIFRYLRTGHGVLPGDNKGSNSSGRRCSGDYLNRNAGQDYVKLMTVLDVQGVRLADMSSDVIRCIYGELLGLLNLLDINGPVTAL